MEFYESACESHKKRERAKARDLRNSQWWKQKLAQAICYYCELSFPPEELTMDHKIPIARGGKSTKGNLVVACKACNTTKKHLTPAEQLLNSL
ncbi:MAG: HNH endonuclease [Bdellovibrionales bacterium]|nr:HNH endonuclease [Bdellovibrionales bacterium]